MKTILAFSLIVLFAAKGMAQKSEAIAGVWWNDKKTSKIEIKEQNGQFVGTVIYISPTSYVDGQPEKDFNNPDPDLRSKSRLGLQILSGLKYVAKDNQWQNGRIYDPDNGKTYDCYAWFENDPNTLYLKGYVVGIKWLGRSTTWTRATEWGIYSLIQLFTLQQASGKQLQEVLTLLLSNPDLRLEIQGHTDNDGSADYNQRLSQQRAESVLRYLLLFGIDSVRLQAKGYGETMPVAPNDTAENKAKNRRVELTRIGN